MVTVAILEGEKRPSMNLFLTVLLFSYSNISQVFQTENVVKACFCDGHNVNVDSNVKVTEMLFIDKSNPCNHPY